MRRADVIRWDYDGLAAGARIAETEAANVRVARTQIITALDSLRTRWVGPAADTFFAHMDADIDPAMERLLAALVLLHEAFVTLGKDLRQTEEDAAALFDLWGGLPPESETDANPDAPRGGLTSGHTDAQGNLIGDEDGIPPVDMVAIRTAREAAAREAAIAEVEAALTAEFGAVTLNVDPALSPEERLAVLQQVYADLTALKAYNVALTGAAWAPAEIALVREAVAAAAQTAFGYAQEFNYVPGRVTNAQDAFRDVYAGGRDRTVTVERVATNGHGMFMRDGNRVSGPGQGVVQWYGQASASTNVIELSDRAFAPTPGDDFSALQLVAHEIGHLAEGRHRNRLPVPESLTGLAFTARSSDTDAEKLADAFAASTLRGSYTDDEHGQRRAREATALWDEILARTYDGNSQ